MVIISCTTKFHSFDLAEQLEKNNLLNSLFTSYHSQKNIIFNKFHHRKDQEAIALDKINTLPILAGFIKKFPKKDHLWNTIFDNWVAHSIQKRNNYKVFIGWSGSALSTIVNAKKKGKITIVERGSSHILYQNQILKEEYKRQLGVNFQINPAIIEKELQEYKTADFIVIPSTFVKRSFLEYGIEESKLFQNPYGVGELFRPSEQRKPTEKFRILYLGSMCIRKGLLYLFEALTILNMPIDEYEVWFIGGIDADVIPLYNKYKRSNWTHFGFIEHNSLTGYINKCDIAVQPSIEEGLARVIPQMLGCGVPVIATHNSGGEDIIENEKSGFIVPIRSPESIKERIEELFFDKNKLQMMKNCASQTASIKMSWNQYGNRYSKFLESLI